MPFPRPFPAARGRRLLPCLAAAVLLSAPLRAQPAAGADLTLSDNWVWRGLTRASSPTAQPAVWARVDGHGHALAAGAWAAFELGHIHPADVTTSGLNRWQLGEIDVWSQATARVGTTDVAAGIVRYLFQGNAARRGRGPAFNTTEVYAQLQPRPGTLPVDPRATLFWDVDRAHGGYLEVNAARSVTMIPDETLLSLLLSATAGFALRQRGTLRGGDFARSGPTHLDLSLGLTPRVPPRISFVAMVHHARRFQAARDALPGDGADHRTWLEFAASVRAGHARREQ
jgi:hypothetical protein